MSQHAFGNPQGIRGWMAPVIVVISLASVAALVLMGGGCGEEKTMKGWKVAVDILPYGDLVSRVSGGRVEVEVLIPAGASPHSYDLTPRQWAFLEEADLVVVNGLGLEPWMDDLLKKGVGKKVLVVGELIPPEMLISVGEGRPDHPCEVHTGVCKAVECPSGCCESGPVDPHVWLDPHIMSLVAEEIAAVLAELDPDRSGFYRDKAREFREEVERLDEEIRRELSSLKHRRFVAYHSAWTYFCRRYGLVQVGVIEDRPGEEPGAGKLVRLADEMRSTETMVVFTEPQLGSRVGEILAREVGSRVKVVELDPLGRDDDPERSDYIRLMRYNLRRMVSALAEI